MKGSAREQATAARGKVPRPGRGKREKSPEQEMRERMLERSTFHLTLASVVERSEGKRGAFAARAGKPGSRLSHYLAGEWVSPAALQLLLRAVPTVELQMELRRAYVESYVPGPSEWSPGGAAALREAAVVAGQGLPEESLRIVEAALPAANPKRLPKLVELATRMALRLDMPERASSHVAWIAERGRATGDPEIRLVGHHMRAVALTPARLPWNEILMGGIVAERFARSLPTGADAKRLVRMRRDRARAAVWVARTQKVPEKVLVEAHALARESVESAASGWARADALLLGAEASLRLHDPKASEKALAEADGLVEDHIDLGLERDIVRAELLRDQSRDDEALAKLDFVAILAGNRGNLSVRNVARELMADIHLTGDLALWHV